MFAPRIRFGALLLVAMVAAACGNTSSADDLARSVTPRTVATTAPSTTAPVTTERATTVRAKPTTTTTEPTSSTTTTLVPSTTTEAPTTTTTSLPTEGTGIFVWASEGGEPVGRAPYRTYQVGIELGSGLDPDVVAGVVEGILSDRRSWIGDGRSGFRRVVDGASLRVVIATPKTVDRLCAPLRTNGWLSCAQGRYAAINLHRWLTATDEWDAPLVDYWRYVINHEMGHQIGKGHRFCPGEGRVAPVMQQQTKTLDGCTANGWPYPDDRAG